MTTVWPNGEREAARRFRAEVAAMLRTLADMVEAGEDVEVSTMRNVMNMADEIHVTVKVDDRLRLRHAQIPWPGP